MSGCRPMLRALVLMAGACLSIPLALGDGMPPEVRSPLPLEENALSAPDLRQPPPGESSTTRIILAAILAVSALAGAFIVSNVRRGTAPEPPKKIPPHEAALAALEALRAHRPGTPGERDAFFAAYPGTLRRHAAARFRVNALESTTDELETRLENEAFPPEQERSALIELLDGADRVKFSRRNGGGEGLECAIAGAAAFVRSAAGRAGGGP